MRLGPRSRTILAISGAALAVAAYALLPLHANSAVTAEDSTRAAGNAGSARPPAQAKLQRSRIDDPFAHPLFEEDSTPPRRPSLARRQAAVLRLRAIVAGKERLALIDDGSTRIVGPGDSVHGARIVEIRLDDMRLSDGRVLRIDGTTR